MSYILVVEDNPETADLVTRILERSGFKVKQTYRGLRGVQLARAERPGLIIMDLNLPDVTGQTAILLIKKQLGNAAPPIIALSGYTSVEYKEEALKIGCMAFLSKPLAVQELLDTVSQFVTVTREPVSAH